MNSNIKNKLIFAIFLAIISFTLFSITVFAEGNFALDYDNLDVPLNGTKYLPYNGGSGNVNWSSSNQSVATVKDGLIEGHNIGTTTITATRGGETASCTVNVVYNSLSIGGNAGKSIASVSLILGEHATETLTARVQDGDYEDIDNASVTWKSSDTSIVTIDDSGVISAVKPGTATITATAAGVEDTCEVMVYGAPQFTDFSNAQYSTSLNWTTETLQIRNVTPTQDSYYYIITPNNVKPNLELTNSGSMDTEKMKDVAGTLLVNTDENYIYTRNISKYAELNQDLYLWVIQSTKLENFYYNSNGVYTSYATRFVVEGKKIEKAPLPSLNLILQTFNIGYWNSTTSDDSDNYTYINFNFPTETENRKFTLKIGRVTDNAILSKIQNNNYEGITDLLNYAKTHDAIYSQTLTTTSPAYFRSDAALFDGNALLQPRGYYYIYVEFDNENGKYAQIEGVTLGQAWLSSTSNSWDLWAYTSSDFNWDDLSVTPAPTPDPGQTPSPAPTPTPTPGQDQTLSPSTLPKTGVTSIVIVSLVAVAALGVFFYIKYNKFKEIK